MAAVAVERRPPRHKVKVRHRYGLYFASCKCGWSSEEAISKYSAWMAMQGHLNSIRPPSPTKSAGRPGNRRQRRAPTSS